MQWLPSRESTGYIRTTILYVILRHVFEDILLHPANNSTIVERWLPLYPLPFRIRTHGKWFQSHSFGNILNPSQRWAAHYGWRSLSPLETYVRFQVFKLTYTSSIYLLPPQASFVFWHEIGRRMGIQDIPETVDELESWSLVSRFSIISSVARADRSCLFL